jgi:hypothetical protein
MPNATPKVTRRDVMDWCPVPRGKQPKGVHEEVPEMTGENADTDPAGFAQNRILAKQIATALHTLKKNDNPADDDKGPRFVIQWRLFPNASNPKAAADQCGCGCSCGCG